MTTDKINKLFEKVLSKSLDEKDLNDYIVEQEINDLQKQNERQ